MGVNRFAEGLIPLQIRIGNILSLLLSLSDTVAVSQKRLYHDITIDSQITIYTMPQLDRIDRKILKILQKDARITNKELASQLGLSPPPTLERVKKLEKADYISGYTAVLNPKKIDLGMTMVVSVSLHHHSQDMIDGFYRAVAKLEEVMECYHVTGEDDFMLKVVCKDIDEYERFVREKLAGLNSLGKIKSSVVLSTLKKVNEYPIRESLEQ